MGTFVPIWAGQMIFVRNRGRVWFKRNAVQVAYCLSAGFALGGVAYIIYAAIASTEWTIPFEGAVWLVLAASWLFLARQFRRRGQLDQAVPGAGQDVLILVRQGRKIEAIKRYREMNPGIGLREAKHVIDGL